MAKASVNRRVSVWSNSIWVWMLIEEGLLVRERWRFRLHHLLFCIAPQGAISTAAALSIFSKSFTALTFEVEILKVILLNSGEKAGHLIQGKKAWPDPCFHSTLAVQNSPFLHSLWPMLFFTLCPLWPKAAWPERFSKRSSIMRWQMRYKQQQWLWASCLPTHCFCDETSGIVLRIRTMVETSWGCPDKRTDNLRRCFSPFPSLPNFPTAFPETTTTPSHHLFTLREDCYTYLLSFPFSFQVLPSKTLSEASTRKRTIYS